MSSRARPRQDGAFPDAAAGMPGLMSQASLVTRQTKVTIYVEPSCPSLPLTALNASHISYRLDFASLNLAHALDYTPLPCALASDSCTKFARARAREQSYAGLCWARLRQTTRTCSCLPPRTMRRSRKEALIKCACELPRRRKINGDFPMTRDFLTISTIRRLARTALLRAHILFLNCHSKRLFPTILSYM